MAPRPSLALLVLSACANTSMAYVGTLSTRALDVKRYHQHLHKRPLGAYRMPLSFHGSRPGYSNSNTLFRAPSLVSKTHGHGTSARRSSIDTETDGTSNALSETSEEEEDEYEEVEFEYMLYDDMLGSEWKIGDLMEDKKQINEYWFRLLTNEEVVWGDNSKGKWKLDERAQFLTISKESFGGWLGKKIWACNLVDFYYLEGTIRGWTPLEAATVKGQWQAKRLGCTDEERGPAPWFEDEGDEEREVEGVDDVDGVDLVRKNVVEDYTEKPKTWFADDDEDTEST